MAFSQQELMAAHNIARHSAELATVEAGANSTVEALPEQNRKTVPDEEEHPFGANDNNKRVAIRIASEEAKKALVSVPTPLTPGQAAARDLALAAKLDAANGVPLTDEEAAAADDAATAAILAAKQAEDIKAAADSAKTPGGSKPPAVPKAATPPAPSFPS